ncbi:hypothetical protein FOQG_16914 [Fusarium oxysporum f. sp. raphani 54005]|uniref:Uncharacterized protein n=4 Tax=Fusarium oxysporum TaxID=5507 RepID=X0BHT1_FUSOX|nr:hypothetical protein FOXB_05792 [Fusarium oxysporum f. sp. conglutinans Fo5176]EXK78423.1 hypothetical protein FOQG_16914 [Fusarium oxysporum f. sp. raphani 54005]KAF6517551.1 hypothetical protein HZS61_003112 [Fusarium oxysporum f. sp. conglutinans]KAG7410324.1 hypothetical protein Forpi1262_v017536 [Fusarium oxysporum f. sp. raphani]KAI8404334.1 hypothetical protein FOFC_15829 [Fusarium oxysporum]
MEHRSLTPSERQPLLEDVVKEGILKLNLLKTGDFQALRDKLPCPTQDQSKYMSQATIDHVHSFRKFLADPEAIVNDKEKIFNYAAGLCETLLLYEILDLLGPEAAMNLYNRWRERATRSS